MTACVEDWHRLLSCARCFFIPQIFFCFFRFQTRHEAGREVFLFFHARFTIDFVSGVSFADWTVFVVGSLSWSHPHIVQQRMTEDPMAKMLLFVFMTMTYLYSFLETLDSENMTIQDVIKCWQMRYVLFSLDKYTLILRFLSIEPRFLQSKTLALIKASLATIKT